MVSASRSLIIIRVAIRVPERARFKSITSAHRRTLIYNSSNISEVVLLLTLQIAILFNATYIFYFTRIQLAFGPNMFSGADGIPNAFSTIFPVKTFIFVGKLRLFLLADKNHIDLIG